MYVYIYSHGTPEVPLSPGTRRSCVLGFVRSSAKDLLLGAPGTHAFPVSLGFHVAKLPKWCEMVKNSQVLWLIGNYLVMRNYTTWLRNDDILGEPMNFWKGAARIGVKVCERDERVRR